MKAKRIAAILMMTVWFGMLAACDQDESSPPVIDSGNATEQAPLDAATPDKLSDSTTNEGSEEPTATTKPKAMEVLAKQLNVPWVITFDGDVIYISEREGNIVKVNGDEMTRQSVNLLKNVQHQGEGGFLGLLLAPDFHLSRTAYAYHTYMENGELLNRVVMLKQSGNEWNEVRALVEGIPGASNHDGGRMAFGPDGLLYVTTGDAQQRQLAQDKNSLAGKILRMTLEGKVPEDNPFANSYVYSYGHRNPQGLVWDYEGVMYSTEHGPSGNPGGHDEINRIEAGGNYGWPVIYGDQEQKGMIRPLYHTGETAIAPSGAAIDEHNRIWFATLLGETLYRYNPETKAMDKMLEGEGRLRDVKIKDGRVYVITNNTDGRGIPLEQDDRLLVFNEVEVK